MLIPGSLKCNLDISGQDEIKYPDTVNIHKKVILVGKK